jgi:hypothetical protein
VDSHFRMNCTNSCPYFRMHHNVGLSQDRGRAICYTGDNNHKMIFRAGCNSRPAVCNAKRRCQPATRHNRASNNRRVYGGGFGERPKPTVKVWMGEGLCRDGSLNEHLCPVGAIDLCLHGRLVLSCMIPPSATLP